MKEQNLRTTGPEGIARDTERRMTRMAQPENMTESELGWETKAHPLIMQSQTGARSSRTGGRTRTAGRSGRHQRAREEEKQTLPAYYFAAVCDNEVFGAVVDRHGQAGQMCHIRKREARLRHLVSDVDDGRGKCTTKT